MKIEVTTSIQNGIFKRNRNIVLDAIKSFNGFDVVLTIAKAKKKRSNNQNAYYWGLLIPLTQNAIKTEWGEIWSKEKTHDFYKLHFNYIEKVNENTSEVIKIPKSTTDNTTTQQEEYHTQIREFLKDWFNVTAPLPNDGLELNL